jgi:hypothetical protein
MNGKKNELATISEKTGTRNNEARAKKRVMDFMGIMQDIIQDCPEILNKIRASC